MVVSGIPTSAEISRSTDTPTYAGAKKMRFERRNGDGVEVGILRALGTSFEDCACSLGSG